MAASVKYQWCLLKYAKFVYGDDTLDKQENAAETIDIPCKGKWKVYTENENNLKLSYLESDHLLITHDDVILESFSLINSYTWLKGVAKRDSLLVLNKLKDGNNRRFRIQFGIEGDENDGCIKRKQCTEMLKKHFPITDNDISDGPNSVESASIDETLFNKQQYREAYAVDIPKENLKDIIMLCLTDTTFPSYVAEVDTILKYIGK